MAGHFEVFTDDHLQLRFRLIATTGAILLESGPYKDKRAVAAAIFDVRECAGTGLVEDHSTAVRNPGFAEAMHQDARIIMGRPGK
ncbi:YegP family protein [Arthrobacter silvisoli]|uniref:YegP family protein n=1 Tax=Arthrobacter silvisoli TaxID=2291022 RepID=UPI000E2109EB|nr:DUF1508 domain-containing protein [Arthrobacter silvisoli]